MASIREQAVADILAAAVTTDALGEALTIDGASVVAVRTRLSAEERIASGFDGLNSESMVLSLDKTTLAAVPVPGQMLTVDGVQWNVLPPVNQVGDLVRLVLQRYVG